MFRRIQGDDSSVGQSDEEAMAEPEQVRDVLGETPCAQDLALGAEDA